MQANAESHLPMCRRSWFTVLLCALMALAQTHMYERATLRANNDIVTRVSHSSHYVKQVLQQQIPAMYFAMEHGIQASADTKGWMRVYGSQGQVHERSFGGEYASGQDLVENHRVPEDIAAFTFSISPEGNVFVDEAWMSSELRDVQGEMASAIQSGLYRLWTVDQVEKIEGAIIVRPIRIERVQVYDPGAAVFTKLLTSVVYVMGIGALVMVLYGLFSPYKIQRLTALGANLTRMPIEVGLLFYPLLFIAILLLVSMGFLWGANLGWMDIPYYMLKSRSFFRIMVFLGSFQANIYGYMLAIFLKSWRYEGFLNRSALVALVRWINRGLGRLFRFDLPTNRDYEIYGRIFFWIIIWASYLILIDAPYIPIALFIGIAMSSMKVRTQKQLNYLEQSAQKMIEGDYETLIDLDRAGVYRNLAGQLNRLSQGMKEAVDAKVQNERLKTELISNVSHDLRTPLTAILNYADLLQREDLSQEERAEYAAIIHKKTKRLHVLMDDLLEVTKTTSGAVDLDPVDLDLSALVRQALGEYEDRLTQAGLEVVQEWPEEAMVCLLDGRKTFRIFDNLISNLVKYAMKGTRVYVTGRIREGEAEVVIKNVANYPMNYDASRMMERFVRGDLSRSSEGSGLGLAIAQDLAHLQGGKMRLEVDGDLFKTTLSFKCSRSSQDAGQNPGS